VTLVVVALRFGTPSWIHTWANKAAGALVFFVPLFLPGQLFDGAFSTPAIVVALAAASLSAFEELLVALSSRVFDADRKSFFVRG
jgi:hypothetical protein